MGLYNTYKTDKLRFIPNNDGHNMSKEYYNLPVIINRVKLLRAIYPYLKILKDNHYISERTFHAETRFLRKDHLPVVYYSYRFTFTPFKKEADSSIRLELAIDPLTDEVVVNIIRLKDKDMNDKNNLLGFVFCVDKRTITDLTFFENTINNIHLITVEYLYKNNGVFGFLACCETYIPDDLKVVGKIANMIESAKGVKKFCL